MDFDRTSKEMRELVRKQVHVDIDAYFQKYPLEVEGWKRKREHRLSKKSPPQITEPVEKLSEATGGDPVYEKVGAPHLPPPRRQLYGSEKASISEKSEEYATMYGSLDNIKTTEYKKVDKPSYKLQESAYEDMENVTTRKT